MASKDYDDETVDNGLTERERETLPKWASDRIKDLRRSIESAERKLQDQLDRTEPTTVAYGDVYENPRYLPDGRYDRINVSLDGTTEPVDGVWMSFCRKEDEQTKAPYIEVSCSNGVAVVSQAYNVVRIHAVDRGQLIIPKDPEK